MSQQLDLVGTPGEGGIDAIVKGAEYRLKTILYKDALSKWTVTVTVAPTVGQDIQVTALGVSTTYTSVGETTTQAAAALAKAITRGRHVQAYDAMGADASSLVATAVGNVVTLEATQPRFDLAVSLAGAWTATAAETVTVRQDLTGFAAYMRVADPNKVALSDWDANVTITALTGEVELYLTSVETLALTWRYGTFAIFLKDTANTDRNFRAFVGDVIAFDDGSLAGAAAQ